MTTQPDKSNGPNYLSVRLREESRQRLAEMATEAGIRPGQLAALLLEELLPTVQSVKTRIQIVRTPTNGGAR